MKHCLTGNKDFQMTHRVTLKPLKSDQGELGPVEVVPYELFPGTLEHIQGKNKIKINFLEIKVRHWY